MGWGSTLLGRGGFHPAQIGPIRLPTLRKQLRRFGIGDGGIIEDVIAIIMLVDLLTKLLDVVLYVQQKSIKRIL